MRKTIAAGSSSSSETVEPGTSRAEPRASQAPTIVPKPPVSKRTTATVSTSQVERDLLGDDGEELDGVGLERDCILDALLRGPPCQVGRVVQDRDDAGDEAELVAAREPPALRATT